MCRLVKIFMLGVVFFSGCHIVFGVEKPNFKMIIRLWPDHHNNPELSDQLIDALKKYPNFCDEVWLCPKNTSDEPYEEMVKESEKMADLSNRMRKLNILPSIQVVCIGHPENSDNSQLVGGGMNINWGTIVGPDGAQAKFQSCPRQSGFREFYSKAYGLYAKACQPYGFWLDDDYRLTSHHPASAICYCEDCIGAFNVKYGYHYDREMLVKALDENAGAGKLRLQWIDFCQEGLVGFAAAVSKSIHENSPKTKMGLQHVMFHRALLEGYDWNKTFDAMERETGIVPASRPGNGFYNDHSPRGMLEKGLDIARQIRRLNKNIVEISPELEGYFHKATGKSPHGACVETMYYLSMGATQMSYALICSGQEPMEWYADNYFKALQKWHAFAKEYADFNFGTEPGGINPYISKNHVCRSLMPGEGSWKWTQTNAHTCIYGMAPLGIPFCPDGNVPTALMIEEQSLMGISDEEALDLFRHNDIVVDEDAWKVLKQRNLLHQYDSIATPGDIEGTLCYQMAGGRRLAVLNGFISDVNIKERNAMLRTFDWASHGHMPVLMESMSQTTVIPRVDAKGCLHSVALLNCSISEQESYTLRLRLGRDVNIGKKKFVWKKNGCKDVKLKPKYEGDDVILTVPELEGWNFGWIAVL